MSTPLTRRTTVLALALTVGLSAPVAAQTTIGAPGGGTITPFGLPIFRSAGQSITVPSFSILENFSFWLGPAVDEVNPTPIPNPTANLNFRAYVFAWNGSRPTGSALFASGVRQHIANASTPLTQFMFNTGGIALTPGDVYALFVSTSELAGFGQIAFGWSGGDTYAGGGVIAHPVFDTEAEWTSDIWGFRADDLQFEATFTPEPSTWVMLATGLFGLGIAARRRARRDEIELEDPREAPPRSSV